MKKALTIVILLLFISIIAYLLGPTPERPVYNTQLPEVPSSPTALENYVKGIDSHHKIKPGNGSEIVWNDSTKTKTPYAVLYLHGFSASHEEGNPVHRNFAKRYGCNLYLARLAEHGIDTTDAMANLTAENYWRSAVQAYAIAKQLGDKVIILGTSTGGTLALKLAAEFPEIHALLNLSPNIAINDPTAFIANNHWGLKLAELVLGGKYRNSELDTAEGPKYWYYKYRIESVSALEELLETSMTKETFEKVKCPVLTVCYYKDEQHQDPVVKVSAMREMMEQLGTPSALKQFVPLATPENHVLGNPLKSKDIKSVENACYKFAEKVLKLSPNVNI
ncbi:alpha/beta hydrolase [Solitalea sp. MAHUQ-68]|uniref:Alpha/beta hydrolase n=1 Tax=Solitalea agri TaxID=2953739 RepID=A0A9X2F4F3_9SPHI|nr:acyl-CoA thioester hydrolase/BAAT C-terminal domain-containing protein [Solitalea agri]MCO4292141.1 alpha/beta hydrolase [Solitalea agri]